MAPPTAPGAAPWRELEREGVAVARRGGAPSRGRQGEALEPPAAPWASLLEAGAWLALVALAVWWGRTAVVGRGLGVNAAPLVGHWIWRPGPGLVIPTVVAVAVVLAGPRTAAVAPWARLPWLAGATGALWATTLAASDGWDRITAPLTTRHEYEPFAAGIHRPGAFLRNFVEELPGTPIHVQGHPPGAPLVPWALDRVGLAGAGWFAALVVAGWGLAIGSALLAARSVAGEAAARRAAPALVLLPAALWAGTSADALFAGVLAAGVAISLAGLERLVAVGGSPSWGRPRQGPSPQASSGDPAGEDTARGAVRLARQGVSRPLEPSGLGSSSRRWPLRWQPLAGGAVLGLGLLLSYGGAAVVLIPVAVLLWRRRILDAVLVPVGAGAVLVAVAVVSGFWWFDGLAATHAAYLDGVATQRPGAYFALIGNPAALALAAGPAVVAGVAAAARRWRAPASLLPVVGLAVVVLVDASMLSKGEVERIWLPFVPWLALAAPGHRRGWLAVQAGLALVLQAWLRSKW